MMNRLKHLLTVILVLLGFNLSAQQIMSLTDFRNSDSKEETAEFQRLVYDNLPTIYLRKEKPMVEVNSPVRVVSDIYSWDQLDQVKDPASIEVIILRVHTKRELKQMINLKLLDRFSALKHVFIAGDFSICEGLSKECEKDKVSGILNGSSDALVVYDFQTIN